jgi:prepilin-type processing-associated H-X9-DG protein
MAYAAMPRLDWLMMSRPPDDNRRARFNCKEHPMRPTARFAFTQIDLLACVVCLLIGATVISIALGQIKGDDAPFNDKTIKDATQVRAVHQSWIVYSREFNGIFPVPGLIDRLPVEGVGEVPGRGEEDTMQNTTANLHSAMVMYNYYTVDLLISPVERNPNVRVFADYNYELYDVVNADVYWDPNFKADLKHLSHVSYANMPLSGERKAKQWRDTLGAMFSVIGNRGSQDGRVDPTSITCGPHGNWAGNIVFQDNHVQLLQSTVFEYERDGVKIADNLFASDGGVDRIDILLAFTRSIDDKGVDLQFD